MVKIIKYNFAEINANPLKYIIEKDCKELHHGIDI